VRGSPLSGAGRGQGKNIEGIMLLENWRGGDAKTMGRREEGVRGEGQG